MRINILHMGFFYSGGGERVALMQARQGFRLCCSLGQELPGLAY